jgi:tRNA (mo5U34)-methyltransferase
MGIEAVPPDCGPFDTVFSMGVLYHRRSPMEHLQTLRDCLRAGGQLVLETLVIEGDATPVPGPRGALRAHGQRLVYPEQRHAAACGWQSSAGKTRGWSTSR